MEFYNYSKSSLQLMFKNMNYDVDVLENFLVKCKSSMVELILEEFEKWERGYPKYADKLISLIAEE